MLSGLVDLDGVELPHGGTFGDVERTLDGGLGGVVELGSATPSTFKPLS